MQDITKNAVKSGDILQLQIIPKTHMIRFRMINGQPRCFNILRHGQPILDNISVMNEVELPFAGVPQLTRSCWKWFRQYSRVYCGGLLYSRSYRCIYSAKSVMVRNIFTGEKPVVATTFLSFTKSIR